MTNSRIRTVNSRPIIPSGWVTSRSNPKRTKGIPSTIRAKEISTRARASSSLTEDSHELFGGLSTPITERVNVTGYGVAGLSKGSPDFGLGLLFTVKVF